MFSEKCNSCRIAIQWFHVNQYLGIPYTKVQVYTFRVQGLGFLRDTRFGFPDYSECERVVSCFVVCFFACFLIKDLLFGRDFHYVALIYVYMSLKVKRIKVVVVAYKTIFFTMTAVRKWRNAAFFSSW